MDTKYRASLSDKITAVFRNNPEIPDHRKDHPWWIGALGSIQADVVFVGENPSLSQLEAATDPVTGGPPTIETQWWQSRGDKLLREALIGAGFKGGTLESKGGWRCYITNVIKQADYAEKWKKKGVIPLREAAELWSPVLSFELTKVNPRVIVAMGNKPHKLLLHLMKKGLIPRHQLCKVHHYSYVALRADAKRKLGPMNPIRVSEYKEQILAVARTL
jgi:hypothetical protein